MSVTAIHYKRLRLQLDLRKPLDNVQLAEGYHFIPWQPLIQERHAQVQWRAFREDLDGRLFNCLSNLAGCRRLLHETVNHSRFSGESTWLVQFQPEPEWPAVDCAMVQGLTQSGLTGAIQNLGVVPEHRSFGLGRSILLQALHGFRRSGMRRVTLEVTAENLQAVRLYLKLGFNVSRVLYRTAEAGTIVKGSERPPRALETEVPLPG